VSEVDETITIDESAETPEGTDVAESGSASGRRGRPRPDEVIKRDEHVLSAIIGPMTRKQIAEATGYTESHTYLSLLRLRNAGRVQHERNAAGHVWFHIIDAEPAVDSTVEAG
jgi:hypothetical protein